MKVIEVDHVKNFVKAIEAKIIEAKTNLDSLELWRDSNFLARLTDRLKEIHVLCEMFMATLEKLETTVDLDEIDVDREELICLRDKDESRAIRFIAGYLLKLTYEVRYPNKEEV